MLPLLTICLLLTFITYAWATTSEEPQPTVFDPSIWPAVPPEEPTPVASPPPYMNASDPVPPGVDFAPVCDLSTNSCPACDSWYRFASAQGNLYSMHCDTVILSSRMYQQTGKKAANESFTIPDCIEACDDFAGCQAASFVDGICYLATAEDVVLTPHRDAMAFLRLPPENESSSMEPVPTTAYSTASSALPTEPTGLRCSSIDFDCPRCDAASIQNTADQRYTVLCGTLLESPEIIPVPRATSIDACLKACDSLLPVCAGASFLQDQCMLAIGIVTSYVEASSWSAFLPVEDGGNVAYSSIIAEDPAPSTHEPWTFGRTTAEDPSITSSIPDWRQMSAFPTGAFTSANIGMGGVQTTTALAEPVPSSACSGTSALCPQCDGQLAADYPGETYRLVCDRGPTCSQFRPASIVRDLASCLSLCDDDLNCFAGRYQYNSSVCTICLGRPRSEDDYSSEVGFYPELQKFYALPSLPASMLFMSTALVPVGNEASPAATGYSTYSLMASNDPTTRSENGVLPSTITPSATQSTGSIVSGVPITAPAQSNAASSGTLTFSSITAARGPDWFPPIGPELRCPYADRANYNLGSGRADSVVKIFCGFGPMEDGLTITEAGNFSACADYCDYELCSGFAWRPDDSECEIFSYFDATITVSEAQMETAAIKYRDLPMVIVTVSESSEASALPEITPQAGGRARKGP